MLMPTLAFQSSWIGFTLNINECVDCTFCPKITIKRSDEPFHRGGARTQRFLMAGELFMFTLLISSM